MRQLTIYDIYAAAAAAAVAKQNYYNQNK